MKQFFSSMIAKSGELTRVEYLLRLVAMFFVQYLTIMTLSYLTQFLYGAAEVVMSVLGLAVLFGVVYPLFRIQQQRLRHIGVDPRFAFLTVVLQAVPVAGLFVSLFMLLMPKDGMKS